jgi:hypothetical protein
VGVGAEDVPRDGLDIAVQVVDLVLETLESNFQ